MTSPTGRRHTWRNTFFSQELGKEEVPHIFFSDLPSLEKKPFIFTLQTYFP